MLIMNIDELYENDFFNEKVMFRMRQSEMMKVPDLYIS